MRSRTDGQALLNNPDTAGVQLPIAFSLFVIRWLLVTSIANVRFPFNSEHTKPMSTRVPYFIEHMYTIIGDPTWKARIAHRRGLGSYWVNAVASCAGTDLDRAASPYTSENPQTSWGQMISEATKPICSRSTSWRWESRPYGQNRALCSA